MTPKAILFAEEQIILARERTTLSWIRFGLALIIASVTLFHFTSNKFSYAVSSILLSSGIMLVAIELKDLHKQKQVEKRIIKKTHI